MKLFKKSLKVGRKVATIKFNFDTNRDEFKVGKIVAIKHQMIDFELAKPYAVRFDDGEIQVFAKDDLYTEWGEE